MNTLIDDSTDYDHNHVVYLTHIEIIKQVKVNFSQRIDDSHCSRIQFIPFFYHTTTLVSDV